MQTARVSRVVMYGVFAALLALAGCGGSTSNDVPAAGEPQAAEPEDGTPGPRPKIVALGDSLTAGLGLPAHQAYPALLQRKIDEAGYELEVVNAGVSGDTTAGGLRRTDWALEGDVRVLIVALGANDGLRGLSVGEMKKNLAAIIERAKEKQIVVILAGMQAPPNYGPEYTAAFRQAYQDVAREQNVRLIPFLLEGVAGISPLNQGDGIHPNAEGAAIMAETVWRGVRPLLDDAAAER